MITDASTLSQAAVAMPAPKILLVFPRFNPNSFWALEDTCRLVGAKTTAPPLGLLTVAALLPQDWDIRLINRNVGTLTDADLDWADLVLTGGMLPQSDDAFEVIRLCKAHGVTVAVGGPDATSRPTVYENADFMVLGEVEGIIEDFVAAIRRGERTGRFEAPKFQADVTKTPIPRYDLIKFEDYLYICLQFSRGCPFTCEFCDIIELYGRVPRTKTSDQVLAELDRLLELGYIGHVDFVDDNLIGNKKAIKKFLPDLIAWQKKNSYPFHFSTEASLNLADDDEQLLGMMREANFFTIFMGIESGNTETLIAASKKQNTRRSIGDSVNKLYSNGMCGIAGFILGFDTEKGDVAQEMIDTINETSIPICMIGLLTALPNTQLNRRLIKEGRMIQDLSEGQSPEGSGDQCTAGLNFTTLRPRRDVLADYKTVLESIYTDKAFFERQTRVTDALNRPAGRRKFDLRYEVRNLRIFGRLVMEIRRRPGMMSPFLRYLFHTVTTNPRALEFGMTNVMMYMHVGRFMRFVVSDMDRRIAEIDAGGTPSIPPSHEVKEMIAAE